MGALAWDLPAETPFGEWKRGVGRSFGTAAAAPPALPGPEPDPRPVSKAPDVIHVEPFGAGDGYAPPASGATDYERGAQFASEQFRAQIERLESENQRLNERNETLRDDNAAQYREHRDKLDDVREAHAAELRSIQRIVDKAKEAKADATQELRDLRLETKFEKQNDQSTFDKVLEPLVGSFSALVPALTQRATVPLTTVRPGPPSMS